MAGKKIKSLKIYRSFLIPESEEHFKETEEFLEHLTLYNENSDLLEAVKLGTEGEMETKIIMVYDDKGRLLEETNFHEDGELFTDKKIYVRDDSGKIIAEEKHYLDGSIEKTEYQYDENNNLIKKNIFDEDHVSEGNTDFKFDEKKRLLESARYDESGKLSDRIRLQYDDKDRIVQAEEWDENTGMNIITVNSFNELNEISETIIKNEKGRLLSKIQNSFDEHGNLSKRVLEDQREYHRIDIIYYTYDDQKRMIEEETQGPSGEIRRKITHEYDESGNNTLSIHYETELTQNPGSHYWKTRMEYEFFE